MRIEGQSELGWFRGQLWRAAIHPRAFARLLAREHFGLAGVLVALIAGALLSLSIDTLVLVSRGFQPWDFLSRLATDAVLLGVRMTVTTAIVAAVADLALRALRRRGSSLDQLFTALSFALAPFIVGPLLAALVTVVPESAPLVAVLALLLLIRVVAGLGLNLFALLPPALAAITFVVVLGASGIALTDQIARVRSLAYAYVPTLAAPFAAAPAAGNRVEGDGYSLVLPERWRNATTGVRGEAARFLSDTGFLIIKRVRGNPLLTAEEFADRVAGEEMRGIDRTSGERAVVRIGEMVVVDQRTRGSAEGRPIVMRQFTAVNGSQVMALVFHYVDPPDADAALTESAAVAATWRLGAER